MVNYLAQCVYASRRLKDLRTIANPLAVGPSDQKVERLLKTINLQPSLFRSLNTSNTTSTYLSKDGRLGLLPCFVCIVFKV